MTEVSIDVAIPVEVSQPHGPRLFQVVPLVVGEHVVFTLQQNLIGLGVPGAAAANEGIPAAIAVQVCHIHTNRCQMAAEFRRWEDEFRQVASPVIFPKHIPPWRIDHQRIEIVVTIEVDQPHGSAVVVPQTLPAIDESALAVVRPDPVRILLIAGEQVQVSVTIEVAKCRLPSLRVAQTLARIDQLPVPVIDEHSVWSLKPEDRIQVVIAVNIAQANAFRHDPFGLWVTGGETVVSVIPPDADR